MKYKYLFQNILSETVRKRLIQIIEYESAIPAEINLIFEKGDENLYAEVVKLAAIKVFRKRIKHCRILIDIKTFEGDVRIQVRYPAKKKHRKYTANASGKSPFDINI